MNQRKSLESGPGDCISAERAPVVPELPSAVDFGLPEVSEPPVLVRLAATLLL